MTERFSIGVVSSAADLAAAIRSAMPEAEVHADASQSCDVVIVDDDADVQNDSAVLIRLAEKSANGAVCRDSFLRDPAGYLELARQSAAHRAAASTAEEEIAFAGYVREIMSAGELSAVFQRVGRRAAELSGAAWATLLLHDPIIERFATVYSTDPEQGEGGGFLPGVPADTLHEAMAAPDGYTVRGPQGRKGGMVVVPLRVRDDLIGVLTLSRSKGEAFDGASARTAAEYILAVAPLLITVHQLSKSKDLAMRDDLTKAFNRRFFDAHLDEEIERARRYNSLVSVIFLDLDDLKLINNLYGHLSGSRMLQEVARRILGAVRGIDKVVRFGGDEFCIILPQTDPDQARAVANRVRKAMSDRKFTLEPNIEIAMTASFGIATYPVHARTKEDLIRAADTAMYRVKSTSKNAIEEAVRLERPRAVDAEPAH